MPGETMRIQVTLPKPLVEEINQLVGRAQRNAFTAEAVAEWVQRERLGWALETCAGILDPDGHPEWRTPEMTSAWVHNLRRADDETSERKLNRHRRE